MIKKYCISGDSWGVGEWKPAEPYSKGSGQYDLHRALLFFNHVVGDISQPGDDNPRTISKLKNYLKCCSTNFDYIIWFQSNPLRRLEFIDVIKSSKDFSLDYNFFIETSNRYLDEDYANLNSIGQRIYCIGGLSKLNTTLMSKYSNLVPLLESVPEFLYPDKSHPELCVGDWMLHLDRQVKLDDLEKINQEHKKMMSWSTEEYSKFFNIGDSHPNREAYKLLAVFIMDNIEKF